MKIEYFGTNYGPGPQTVKIKHSNGNVTRLKQRIVWHSPDGFQWGYGGSGPADLALNMLYDYFLRTKKKPAKKLALNLYQLFKRELIAMAEQNLSITGEQIESWFITKT
jgi:hypothetical protein